MTFRIINDVDVIDNGVIHYAKYIGKSHIDYSKIYRIFTDYPKEVSEKMYERDIDYLSTINRKNKINKLNKNDKININDYFIDFYVKNINKVFLIKTE